VGINIEWQGSGINEVAINKATGKAVIKIDPRYFRPTEVDLLLGNPAKAKTAFGWSATTSFEQLVAIMMQHDLNNT
jgi:GDPmannose 4,6-dehydratase